MYEREERSRRGKEKGGRVVTEIQAHRHDETGDARRCYIVFPRERAHAVEARDTQNVEERARMNTRPSRDMPDRLGLIKTG